MVTEPSMEKVGTVASALPLPSIRLMAVVPVLKVGILASNVTVAVPEATVLSEVPRTISPESIIPSVSVSIQAVKLPVTKPLPVAVMDVPLTPDVGLNDTDRALTLKGVVVPQVV